MPHACRIGRPTCARHASDSARGTAEPPQITERRLLVSLPTSSGSTPIQIVGTPAATVTRSSAINAATAGAERSGPGITSDAPAATHACASPHAFAWNIGTIGSTRSRSVMPMLPAASTPKVWSTDERCVATTPFGLPVVPLV